MEGLVTMRRYSRHLLTVTLLIAAVLFLAPPPALASGLMDNTINDAYGFSRYPIAHYALDLYIDPDAGRGWFGISLPDVSRILFSITNAIWELCVFLASAVGSVVQEAFRLDFLSRATDEIGRNIQQIAGVSENGFSTTGFLPMLLPLAVLAMGAYVLYVGLFKREMTKALGAVMNFLVIFVLSIGFIAFAPSYIQAINSLSVDLADGALRITNAILNPGANDTNVAVAGIREALHQVQIHAPWQLLQFGSLDIDPARVHELLSYAPHSDARIDAVIREVEIYNNIHLSGEVDRFGTVLILFFVNLGISIFVLSLTGLMIFSQLLLIFYLTLLPIALVLSLFPTFNGIAKRSIERVFNTLLLRVGYTLIITIAFSLSLLVYRVSSDLSMPFLLVGFLQILVFWGVHKKQDELLGMIRLQSGENHRGERSILRTGRNLGRKALAFGTGIVAGKSINRRRSQQGANIPASNNGSGAESSTETQPRNAESASPVENRGRNSDARQNVTVPPVASNQSDTPKQTQPSQPQSQTQQPIKRMTVSGRLGHSVGRLVDTPSARSGLEPLRFRPDGAGSKAPLFHPSLRSDLGKAATQIGKGPEQQSVHTNQRKQYRDTVEMKQSAERHKPQDKQGGNVEIQRKAEWASDLQEKPQENTAQRGQANTFSQGDASRRNLTSKPNHAPARNTETFKLNGKPVTRDQLDKLDDPSQKRKERRKRRDRS